MEQRVGRVIGSHDASGVFQVAPLGWPGRACGGTRPCAEQAAVDEEQHAHLEGPQLAAETWQVWPDRW